jgi:pyruvate dehydrogenase E1 component alpha subunit
MFDPELYRDKREVEQWRTRDPVRSLRERVAADAGGIEALRGIEASVEQEIAEAVRIAEAGTWEPVESLTRDVYARDAGATTGAAAAPPAGGATLSN